MIRQCISLGVLGLLLSGWSSRAQDPTKPHPDAVAIQGVWKPTTSSFAGFTLSPEQLSKSKSRYVIKKGFIELIDDSGPRGKGPYRIDPTKRPRTIDFLHAEKDVVEAVGIYKLEGDTLWLCFRYSKEEKDRPTEFKPSTRGAVMFLIARRVSR